MATLEQEILALSTAKDRYARKIQWFMQNLTGGTFTSGARTVTLDAFALRDGILDIYVALDVGGTPVGLGPKNVRFERIRIANPPIMVVTGLDADGKPIKQLAPLQALRGTLAHTLKLLATGKRPDSMDSRSDSTLIVYPDGTGGLTTRDGIVGRGSVDQLFADIRAGAGNESYSDLGAYGPYLYCSATNNQFAYNRRYIATFDTSALTAGVTVSAATFSLFGTSKDNPMGSPALHISGTTPASNNAFVNSDYGQFQTVSFGNIAYAGFNTAAYNDITLNAAGISNISKTGISKFGGQLSWDIDASFTGTWGAALVTFIHFYTADIAGTANDPKLTITYAITPVAAASGGFPQSQTWRFFRRP